jgi:hypothetical protein
MGVDVDRFLQQHDEAPTSEPMHGQSGEIRRNPSTDQKRARREISRSEQEARLLHTAATSPDYAVQRQAMADLEALRTEAMAEADEARALDLTAARINDVLVPGHVHELHTAATDWLLELPETTASQGDAEQALIAEATLWYGRVDPIIKADEQEFAEQAKNKARYVASQYGPHAEPAAQAFYAEAHRLLAQDAQLGKLAKAGMLMPDLTGGGEMVEHPHFSDEAPEPAASSEPEAHEVKGPAPAIPSGERPAWFHHLDAPTENLRGMSEAWAGHVLSRASALSREPERFPEVEEQVVVKIAAGAGGGGPMSARDGTVGQADYPADVDTDSSRSPSLQEMQGYTGFDGSSVVTDPTGAAQAANGQQNTNEDYARPQPGFPVSGSHTQKESSVTDHAQCPTCGGLGRVAVRKQAYSGLPQIDQLVNADETPGATPLPTDVAFPLVGLNPGNVQQAINDTEQRMPSHQQPTVQKRTSIEHEGQGRDNSGWIGDMGAKGLDYPGYSAPTGYDGSSALGQPNPTYGYGGDNPNTPKLPFGNDEYNDFLNNPGQPFQYGEAHNDDQGFREVTPAMSTSGARVPWPSEAEWYWGFTRTGSMYYHGREFSQAERDKAAETGHALSDGSYPIYNAKDVDNAKKRIGTGDAAKSTIVRHINHWAEEYGVPKVGESDEDHKKAASLQADPFITAATEEIARQQALISTRQAMLARQAS